MTVSDDFTSLTGPYRGELLAHCYRMLGSADEAEDLVQETYLRAWRAYGQFEGRSSVRTWLYRIATNACLTAIERRGRRPLPSGLGAPDRDAGAALMAAPDTPWLQPIPDALLGAAPGDPAAVAVSRAGTRLAFVAALQYLSARQRAVLILRDVLEWPAAQVAELLGLTPAAVNSALRRARAQLAHAQRARALPAEDDVAEPPGPAQRALLDRFATAFEEADVRALAALLREDIVLEMPPLVAWFAGREASAGFLAANVLRSPGRFRLVATAANGQPAFAVYRCGADRVFRAYGLQVLTVTTTGIARIVVFLDADLLRTFRLPPVLADGAPAGVLGADRLGADGLGADGLGADGLGAVRLGADGLGAVRLGADRPAC